MDSGKQPRAAGFADSSGQADRYLSALIGEATNRELRDAYLQTGPTAIDYLCARTDVQFLACGKHPDYRSNMPGAAVAGRAIMPEPFDGRLLGAEFRRVRPPVPEFMLFGGMMVGKADIPGYWPILRLQISFIPQSYLHIISPTA